MEQILVIGGTGRIARPVVRALIAAGHRVRVLTRDVQRSQSLLPPEVEWCQGDLQDDAALRDALRGSSAVYINLPEAANPRAAFVPDIHGMQRILAAAPRDALLMKLSQFGAAETPNYSNLTLKYRAEAMIRASGNPYIIFRPTWFMESLPLILTQKNTITLVGALRWPIYWIAGEDFGQQVVNALNRREQSQNRVFNIQGPQALTFDEAARRYAAIIGNLRVTRLPLWVMWAGGLFDPQTRADYELMAHMNRHAERFESQGTWDVLGRPTVTLEAFAASARPQA